jgi:hypothetical protein
VITFPKIVIQLVSLDIYSQSIPEEFQQFTSLKAPMIYHEPPRRKFVGVFILEALNFKVRPTAWLSSSLVFWPKTSKAEKTLLEIKTPSKDESETVVWKNITSVNLVPRLEGTRNRLPNGR